MKDNNKNLIPFNKRSKEEHIEIYRKGGIKSGEARRKKREQIDAIKLHNIAFKEEREKNLELQMNTIKLITELRNEANQILDDDLTLLIELLKQI